MHTVSCKSLGIAAAKRKQEKKEKEEAEKQRANAGAGLDAKESPWPSDAEHEAPEGEEQWEDEEAGDREMDEGDDWHDQAEPDAKRPRT